MSFRNEPVLELRRAPVRESLLGGAAASWTRGCRWRCPCWSAANAARPTASTSTDPGAPERLVAARGPGAPRRTPPPRWRRPQRGFRDWSARPAAERAEVLRGAAAILRERRLELAALQVRECAKPWPEADGDVCEAIDFLEYYAREAVELDEGRDAGPGAGRAQHDALRAARRGGGDRALELPAGDPLRHDRRGAGRRATRRC